MKKIILFAFVLTTFASGAFSQTQKYGFVDTEYILSNIPTYAAAQKQLDELAAKWEEKCVYRSRKRLQRLSNSESTSFGRDAQKTRR